MAEFKTAEQYVVEKLETTEKELEDLKIINDKENRQHLKEFEELREQLNDAYELLDMFRDVITVRKDNYWRYVIGFDNIYGKEHPEAVARLMEYYDIRPDEEDE